MLISTKESFPKVFQDELKIDSDYYIKKEQFMQECRDEQEESRAKIDEHEKRDLADSMKETWKRLLLVNYET